MMVSNSEQLWRLFLYLGFGGLLGTIGAVFRIHQHFSNARSLHIFIADCIFFTLSSITLFIFSIPLGGGPMRTVFLAAVIGGYYCIGAVCYRIYKHTAHVFLKIQTAFFRFFAPIFRSVICFVKKVTIFLKKHLRRLHYMLYNHKE